MSRSKGPGKPPVPAACPPSPAKTCQEAGDDLSGGDTAAETPGTLTSRQQQSIEALLREPTVARAATASGVGERSLRRWLTEPVFRAALLRARRDAFAQAIGLTQRYAPVAVATLVKVMNDGAASPSARVTAAGVLLKFGREGIELDDLAERIESLERAAKGLDHPPVIQVEKQPKSEEA